MVVFRVYRVFKVIEFLVFWKEVMTEVSCKLLLTGTVIDIKFHLDWQQGIADAKRFSNTL